MMKKQDTKPVLGEVTIKTEPGTSTSPGMQRLPSLRPPRDLSLSAYSQKNPNLSLAKNKKIYIPNLNIQRNKPIENSTRIKTEPVKPNLPAKSERGRGRGKRTLVQLNQGVFAEGVAAQKAVGRGSGRDVEGNDGVLRRPTLKLKENLKVDKKEEEDTMKQLLKDDFIDDPTLEPDFDNCPIFLPLSKEDPGLKKRSDLKLSEKKENVTLNEILCDNATSDPGYILFQMPSILPGLPVESKADSSSTAQTTSSGQPVDNKATSNPCTLSNLPAGKIGKLQILKSGKARMVFGDTKWWLEMGIQTSFKEELMNIILDKDTHTGDMVDLGPLNVRMTATPDFESIIAAAKVTKTPV